MFIWTLRPCFTAFPALLSVCMCDLAKMFFTSKFSHLVFSNPANKTETGTPNRWGTTNSKPLGPIIMIGQSETLSRSQITFITLFSAGAERCCAYYQLGQPVELCWAKTIFMSQTGIFGLSSSNFIVQDHFLSTTPHILVIEGGDL
jgi:hypothetical protein